MACMGIVMLKPVDAVVPESWKGLLRVGSWVTWMERDTGLAKP